VYLKKCFIFKTDRISLVFYNLLILGALVAVEASSRDGWKLLFENKPVEAVDSFKKAISSTSGRDVAEGYRGLAAAEMFLGNFDTVLDYVLSAYDFDKDIAMASSRPDALISNRNYSGRKNVKKFSQKIDGLAENTGLFGGIYQELQLRHSQNYEDVKKTASIAKKMGIISQWKFIGPFENISGCGFSNVYPPEQETAFKKEYKGKDGNSVIWHDLLTSEATGWIFLDNYVNDFNAMYYLTTTVNSNTDRDAYLSFGASGTFKVFLNSTLVLQDSVFRNTGIDTYMRKVKLHKGINRVLVKIGHEGKSSNAGLTGKANFLLRFLDGSFKPVTDLKADNANETVVKGEPVDLSGSSTPVLDSLSKYLSARLSRDSTDYDALVALIATYNIYDMTNESQRTIQRFLKRYPGSSFLYSSLSESLLRAKKYTDASIAIKKAYDLCNLNMAAWSNQLAGIKSNGNRRGLEEFLDSTPEMFKNEPASRLARLSIAAEMNNNSELYRLITDLEQNNEGNTEILSTLMSIYISQGMFDKAEKLIADQLKQKKGNSSLYREMAALKLKRGDRGSAQTFYQKAIEADPLNPDIYFYLASLLYQEHNYSKSLQYIEKCLAIIPTSSNALNLKGNILASMGRNDDAVATFNKTIKFTVDDFTAWENIFKIKNKKSFESMTPLQSVDSIIKKSGDWVKQQSDQASIVHFCEDIYMYPSDASRSRTFMVVYLPNQQSIDDWKEYRVDYNPNYQLLSIDRAFSKKTGGTEVEADREDNYVVFKSLEPGDYIVLEYSLKDYYQGGMAGKVYGTQLFNTGIPEFESIIRMITPLDDTIPYSISDTVLKVTVQNDGEFKKTTIKAPVSGLSAYEPYTPVYHPSYPAFVYSKFRSWGEISDWYYELSRLKQKPSIELTETTDSLTRGITDDWEKVKRIHEFLTKTINYSFVPFRQSAWIPQSASDVFATRIGDCKDMASLGKAFLDIAGIESWLVLVNTGIHNFTDYAYKGPNFDHCILTFKSNGKDYFVDFTDRNTALGKLPMGDQSAMALVIKPGNSELITLPVDEPTERMIERNIHLELDSTGEMIEKTNAKRTGMFASSLRSMYRFSTYEERKKNFLRSIAQEYPGGVVDTLNFENIDSLHDSLLYNYNLHINNAVDVSGKNIVFEIKIPDALTTDYYPVDQERKKPVDITYSAFGITEQNATVECTFPKSWKLLSVPDDVSVSTGRVRYSLKFEKKGNHLVCKRTFSSNYRDVLSVNEYKTELEVLKKITRADAIKVIFSK
jgi:tetratricopeptide (TPR) repeat protein